MALTTKDFPSLTGEIQSIFDETKKTKLTESIGLQNYGVMDTTLLTHKHQLLHGIKGMSRVAEGQNFPKVGTSEGDVIYYTQNHYAGMLEITKDNRMFWREANGDVLMYAKSMFETAWDQLDTALAEKLIYGWSNSYTDVYNFNRTNNICPDSQVLFSANHTVKPVNGYSFSNLITNGVTIDPVFSRQAIIDTRIRASTFRDPNGVMRGIDLDTLIIPPQLQDQAEQILYSLNYPRLTGTGANADNFAPNNINKTTPLGNLKIVTWNRLYNPAVNYSNTMWFLANSTLMKETMKVLFAQRPVLNAPEKVYENESWLYSMDAYFTDGYGFPAYIYGSKGLN